jgi:glycosyltransferase involved in cell wall biosynthesis
MRVLHIIDSAGVYGAEVMLLDLMKAQGNLGVRPTLGSIGRKGQAQKDIEREADRLGVDVVRFTAFNGPDVGAGRRIAGHARSHAFDVIHTHGYKGSILLGFLPRSARPTPMIRTLHGWTNTRTFSRRGIYQKLDVLSLRRAEAVVAVSRGMLERPPLRGNRRLDVRVIENGIAPPKWRTLEADFDEVTRFCDAGGFVIGAIGRLSREKGYHHLIEAAGILVERGVEARLVIIGDGPARGSLDALIAERGLRGRVLLAGYREDARQYLPCLDVCAMSSLTEGLPITLLEAMHAGVAVVATAVGGIPELLEDGEAGLLVEPGAPKAMAGAIERLHRDPALRETLSGEAGRIAAGRYSARAMARAYLGVYEEMIGERETAR